MTQFPECPGTSKWKKWTLGLNIQSGKHQEELTVLATEEAVQRTVGGETMYLVQSPGVNADKTGDGGDQEGDFRHRKAVVPKGRSLGETSVPHLPLTSPINEATSGGQFLAKPGSFSFAKVQTSP